VTPIDKFSISSIPHLLFLENYTELGKFDEGNDGIVYKAKDSHSGDLIALEMMKINGDDGVSTPTPHEIPILKRISHPNVLRLRAVMSKFGSLPTVNECIDTDLRRRRLISRGMDVRIGIPTPVWSFCASRALNYSPRLKASKPAFQFVTGMRYSGRMIIPVLLIDIRRLSTDILSMEGLIEELAEVNEGIFSESDFWSRGRVQEIVGECDMAVETQANPFL
jgi:hypothetical protein